MSQWFSLKKRRNVPIRKLNKKYFKTHSKNFINIAICYAFYRVSFKNKFQLCVAMLLRVYTRWDECTIPECAENVKIKPKEYYDLKRMNY